MIVEDSPTASMLLRRILESDEGLNVVAEMDSGEDALNYLSQSTRPPIHVITMDIKMPGMDGFTTTQRIMETTPLPIVVVSAAYTPDEAELSFKAIQAGAVAIIEKPVSPTHPDFPAVSANVVETVRLMSEVKVITRFPRTATTNLSPRQPPLKMALHKSIDVVVIGSSTGGPPAIHSILSQLTPDFPAPILLVQHITPGFSEGLARWLEKGTGLPVSIPADGVQCLPGHVYLAPDDRHMGIGAGKKIVLEAAEPDYGQRPSVAHLFRSTALHYPRNAIGILLSGMGNDGAAELKIMKDAGAVTIAQEKSSCVVFGMPWEAIKIDGAHHVMTPEQIGNKIKQLCWNSE